MKKILASLTAACMLLPMCALAACNGGKEPEEPHAHTFAETWSSDETGHWHAATCEHKNEISEKSEHTMSEGKCSVCGYRAPVVLTKDTDFAALVSDKVTEDEWNAAFTNEGFSGCSGRYEVGNRVEGLQFDYIQNEDSIDVNFRLIESWDPVSTLAHAEGNVVRSYREIDGTWYYDELDISTFPPKRAEEMWKYVLTFRFIVSYDFSGHYQEFTYDEEKGAYTFEGTIEFEYVPLGSAFGSYELGSSIKISDAKIEIKFAGGKVAYVRISGTGNSGYCEETYCYFDYDEPKVNFPEDAQPVPQG